MNTSPGPRPLTIDDVPFAEQIADELVMFPGLIEKCGGLGYEWRHRHALMYIGRRTTDDATFRAIVAECRLPDDNDVLCAVLHNPAVPLDRVRELIGCRYWMVCERAASDPRLPADEITALASHKHPGVRRGICLNPSVPPGVLEALTADSVDWVSLAARGVLSERAAGAGHAGSEPAA